MAGAPPIPQLTISRGVCTVMFAYDLGAGIDLNHAERILARLADVEPQRETLKHSRRAPKYFEYHPAPLRLARPAAPVLFGRFVTSPAVDAVLYDFGAVSIAYSIQIDGAVEDLQSLSNQLYENEALLKDSRRVVEELAGILGPAVHKVAIAELVEDYVVFDIDSCSLPAGSPMTLPVWIENARPLLAQVLRADSERLSAQEVDDAMSCRIAYSQADAAIIDWNAAILFGREMQDVLAVLEFANVELLEMRFLDNQLDQALDQAYLTSQREHSLLGNFLGRRGADLRRIARLQTDSAQLFEGVNNALKLLGDPYLARVYRLAAHRFHLPDWDANILRKLGTIESIYDKFSDRQTNQRMEALEWIIILLIAFEVLWSFVPWR